MRKSIHYPWKELILAIITLFILLFQSSLDSFADLPTSQAMAEHEFKKGNWAPAIRIYRDLLVGERAYNRGALHYNLGTSLAKSGKVAEAYLNFFQAVAYEPWVSDYWANFRLSQKQIPPNGLQVMPRSWSLLPSQLLLFLPTMFWFCVGGIFLLTFQGMIFWKQSAIRKRLALFAGGSFLIIGVLSYSLRHGSYYGIPSTLGVGSGPDQSFPLILSLDQGAIVEGLENRDQWIKVRFSLPDGKVVVGWMEEKSLVPIKL